MSLSRLNSRLRARSVSALAITLLLAVAGCQVRPLYSQSSTSAALPAGMAAELAQIAIKPVNTRYGQEVRNQLIFLLQGGAGQRGASTYSMDLFVTSTDGSDVSVQTTGTDDSEPTAGSVTVSGRYSVTTTDGIEVVASGRRSAIATYDIPRQEYAALRAKRDAENRAARELAQMLQIALAQDFSRR